MKKCKILIDADACPVRDIVTKVARALGISVTMVSDVAHELCDDYSEIVTVDTRRDGVDFALLSRVEPGDIVVTQDFGLAAMVLCKRGLAIDQNGRAYTDKNIDNLLRDRYIGQKIRRAGGRTKGPSRRVRADDEKFEAEFARMAERAISPNDE